MIRLDSNNKHMTKYKIGIKCAGCKTVNFNHVDFSFVNADVISLNCKECGDHIMTAITPNFK